MTHRTFISIILAAAIAVTGMSAAPARADNDAAKVIAGVAALAIIGAAIAEERKDRRRKAAARNQVYKNDHNYNYGHRGNRRYDDGHRYSSKRFDGRKSLPVGCRRDGFTRQGEVYGYGRRCLLNNYSQFNALPHDCAVRARGHNGGQRVIYSGRCLRNYGYVTPGYR